MSTVEAPKLECGADLLAIVRQVTDGAPAEDAEHQVSCRFCQAALAGVRQLSLGMQELAARPIVVPADFAKRVMERLARDTDPVRLPVTSGGRTTVTEQIVAQIAREAARRVDGVAYASAKAEEAEGGVDVRVRLVARLGEPLQALAGEVRERVVDDLVRLAGLEARVVDVVVQDVI